MNALAHSYFFWIGPILALLGLCILPSVIAAIRGVEGLGAIIVINLLPTGIGWPAALIGALILPRRETLVQPPPAYLAPIATWPASYDTGSRLHPRRRDDLGITSDRRFRFCPRASAKDFGSPWTLHNNLLI